MAKDSSRKLADERFPEILGKRERQFRAYREASNEELFGVEEVEVSLGEMEEPGSPRSRVSCARCGEGVNDGREVEGFRGEKLCRACAYGAYYSIRQ